MKSEKVSTKTDRERKLRTKLKFKEYKTNLDPILPRIKSSLGDQL